MNHSIKKLSKEQLFISIDRLTRFKNTEEKYLRVFKEVILHNLISPKYKKKDLDGMDYGELRDLAQEVFNYSLNSKAEDYTVNKKLANYEKSVFNTNEQIDKLLDNKINYSVFTEYIDNNSSKNLQWLKALSSCDDIKSARENLSLTYPVEVLVIVEGATEEILLPEFGKICGFDFAQKGVYIMSAGGKNQVVKLYYKMAAALKIPIFILLDKDGYENSLEIKRKIQKKDKIHLLECGEFEDLFPKALIERTLKDEFKNVSLMEESGLNNTESTVKFLEEIHKNRGMHEFKKVEFAQSISNHLKSSDDISPEILDIIAEIRLLKNLVDNEKCSI